MFVQIGFTIVGFFTGFFALVKYFLKHLEKKNGHLERITNDFNETVKNHLRHSQDTQTKLTNSNDNLTRVLERLMQKI